MKRLAILKYEFILDENVPWRNMSQFEAEFVNYFAAIGIDANLVEVKGNAQDKVFYLERIETVGKPPPPIIGKPMTFKKVSK